MHRLKDESARPLPLPAFPHQCNPRRPRKAETEHPQVTSLDLRRFNSNAVNRSLASLHSHAVRSERCEPRFLEDGKLTIDGCYNFTDEQQGSAVDLFSGMLEPLFATPLSRHRIQRRPDAEVAALVAIFITRRADFARRQELGEASP